MAKLLSQLKLNQRLAIGLLLIVTVCLLWVFRFRYDRWKDQPVRISITGKAEVLTAYGWDTLGETQPATDAALPGDELASLKGRAEITKDGWIKLRLENRSHYEVRELTVRVMVRGEDPADVKVDREYELTPGHLAGEFDTPLGFNIAQNQSWTWQIRSARGTPRPAVHRYEVKLSDGRTAEVEGEKKPTEQEVLDLLKRTETNSSNGQPKYENKNRY